MMLGCVTTATAAAPAAVLVAILGVSRHSVGARLRCWAVLLQPLVLLLLY